jgi:hypothetical protein
MKSFSSPGMSGMNGQATWARPGHTVAKALPAVSPGLSVKVQPLLAAPCASVILVHGPGND